MSSPLAAVPIVQRRRLTLALTLFAVLLLAIGAVAATGDGGTAGVVFAAVALVIGLLLALMAWGTARSVRIDLADAGVDAAIEAAMSEHGGLSCGCGHDHDPDELHITDAAPSIDCAHVAGGVCANDCSTCVLAAMRPSTSA